MAIDHRGAQPARAAVATTLLACAAAIAHAGGGATAGGSGPVLALADLRVVGAAAAAYPGVAYPFAPGRLVLGQRLHWVPLAPADAPAASRARCCLQLGAARGAVPAGALSLGAAGPSAPMAGRSARARPAPTMPVIALAFTGAGATVSNLSAQGLTLRWAGLPGAVQVAHCTSGEGLHVRLSGWPSPGAVQQLYLPLGMDVEPSCPPDMLVPPAAASAPR
ncbi:MAG: hypothetical protein HY855_06620 [Burkholderiales bacterium]|nr:hypothetical protein [Burkholderiales bacterium]